MTKAKLLVLAILASVCLTAYSPAVYAASASCGTISNETTTQPNISRYGEDVPFIAALEKANLSLKGNILTAWSVLHNYKASQKNDVYAQTRALLSLTGDISSWLSAELVVGGYGIWDQHDFTNGVTNLPQNGDVKIFGANAKGKNLFGTGIDVTAGRQFMGGVEDAVFYFGPSRDGRFLETTALDAVKAERAIGPVKVVLAGGEKAFLQTGGAMEPPRRQNIYAAEVYSGDLIPSQNIKVFGYGRVQNLVADGTTVLSSGEDQLFCYGFESVGKLPAPGFSYLVTVAQNGGMSQAYKYSGTVKNEKGNYDGYLWRAIGYYDAQPSYGDLNLNGGYVVVSGDDNYADGKTSGFRRIGRDCFYSMAYMTYEIISDGDAESVENVVIPFVGAKYTPSILDKKFQILGNYAVLNTDKNIAGLYGKGSEADLRFAYTLDDNNAFRVIGAKFWPAGFLAKAFGNDPIDQVVLEYELKF